MKIRVAKGPAGDREASLPWPMTLWLKWPGGLWRESSRPRPSATVAALKRRLAELDPGERSEATIRATVSIRTKAGGLRQRTLAIWPPDDRESLVAFLARAQEAAAKIRWPALPQWEDAWIDESDL